MAKKDVLYRQCRFKNTVDGRVTVGWIEANAAKVGNTMQLKLEEELEDNWQVLEVGASMLGEELQERQRDYLNTRKASDV